MKRLLLLFVLLGPLCGAPLFAPLAASFAAAVPASAGEKAVPRTILALYDRATEEGLAFSRAHKLAAMPLNHLGFKLRYHDINAPLPPLAELEDVRGVLTWFHHDRAVADPEAYLDWAEQVIDAGKRFVVIGDIGFGSGTSGRNVPLPRINRFLAKIGLRNTGAWSGVTYDSRYVVKDPAMVEFERPYGPVIAPYNRLVPVGEGVRSFLVVQQRDRSDTASHLVTVSPAGGHVAQGFANYSDRRYQKRQWYINPFLFFRLAFAADDLPKADVTTVSGRRIYYSHIDGDGWINPTIIPRYMDEKLYSSEVIEREIIQSNPDLPVTVAPIAAELDPAWQGSERSSEIGRRLFRLPQVEIGNHSYSHPFEWGFFEDYTPEKELPFIHRYKHGVMERYTASMGASRHVAEVDLAKGYETPRAYGDLPFDLDLEIRGAADVINELAPPGKAVRVMQWSGDTSPWDGAVAAARKAGLLNINGGDSRFDPQYPSYSSVPPIGRPVGQERQIYASTSNENTYTNLWTDPFYGFQDLVHTLKNTEQPRRVKPIDIYYHMYSGERRASLNAVKKNIAYAREQQIAPIATSRYAAIANGFYSAAFTLTDADRWRVSNRGALQTIRFDRADGKEVDFTRSHGVIGQRRHQGNLYVALDEVVEEPVIALKERGEAGAAVPYLEQARWLVRDLRVTERGFSFSAQGFGVGEMVWRVPRDGAYEVAFGEDGEAFEQDARDGRLALTLPALDGTAWARVRIARSGTGRN